jgi:hypothetical protein
MRIAPELALQFEGRASGLDPFFGGHCSYQLSHHGGFQL